MGNKILSFLEFSSISESEVIVDIDQILSPEKKAEIIDQIQKMGITKETPAEFKFKDNEGNEYTLALTPNGDLIVAESMDEGFRKSLMTGIVCTMLAGGMISCQKEDSYDLGKDARYILKPSILNTMGKEAFDSPVEGNDKIYVWAGNQSGGRGTNNRVLYHDYSNRKKDYGAVYRQNYPDSFAHGTNGITPVKVVNKIKLTPEIAKSLQNYSKIDLSQYTDTSTTLGKSDSKHYSGLYVIVVEVFESSHYDWANPNGQEISDPKYKTGYAIYLVTSPIAKGINVGEVYPTMLDIMFDIWNVAPKQIPGNDKVKALDNYMYKEFTNLLSDKPEF